mgnify:CR=1 FL=1
MKKILCVMILILITGACGKKSNPEYKSINYNNTKTII